MRVLIVEDDHRLASSLRRSLVEAGMAVDVAHDGDEGLAAALSTSFDVIVLDVMLPRLSGLEVTRQLRGRRMQAPILMLTGRDAVDDRVAGLDAGADDYLVKPFALREVIARIRALTRRHLSDRTAELRAGPVLLDTAAHVLKVDDQVVELTAKEFAILEYFLLNQNHLLTRGQIIEHVWDYGFQGGRNLVEVYVNRLRSKLIAAGAGDPFVTLRGSGYRYSPKQG
jgi:DNA-binding response OmpR family regulator